MSGVVRNGRSSKAAVLKLLEDPAELITERLASELAAAAVGTSVPFRLANRIPCIKTVSNFTRTSKAANETAVSRVARAT